MKNEKFGLKFTSSAFLLCLKGQSIWFHPQLWLVHLNQVKRDNTRVVSLLLERETTVSNNFTKRRQNGFKRDKYATQRRKENFVSFSHLHNFFYDRWLSHTTLYIHKLSHTPRMQSRIFSLGCLWMKPKIIWNIDLIVSFTNVIGLFQLIINTLSCCSSAVQNYNSSNAKRVIYKDALASNTCVSHWLQEHLNQFSQLALRCHCSLAF